MVKVRMLRPIGGFSVGDTRQMDRLDAERLAATGAVEIVAAKKSAPKRKAG